LDIRLTNGAQENIRLLNDPTSGIKAEFVARRHFNPR